MGKISKTVFLSNKICNWPGQLPARNNRFGVCCNLSVLNGCSSAKPVSSSGLRSYFTKNNNQFHQPFLAPLPRILMILCGLLIWHWSIPIYLFHWFSLDYLTAKGRKVFGAKSNFLKSIKQTMPFFLRKIIFYWSFQIILLLHRLSRWSGFYGLVQVEFVFAGSLTYCSEPEVR